MRATITTTIKTSEYRMWEELQRVSSLLHVAWPLLVFKPTKNSTFPEKWVTGVEYTFSLFFFGIFPLGNHVIKLVEINEETHTIVSNEHGNVARLWAHTIHFQQQNRDSIKYTDEIQFDAGLLTLPVWFFCHIFYRYRHYRWKKFFAASQ